MKATTGTGRGRGNSHSPLSLFFFILSAKYLQSAAALFSLHSSFVHPDVDNTVVLTIVSLKYTVPVEYSA